MSNNPVDLGAELASAQPGAVITLPAGDYTAPASADGYPWKVPAGVHVQGAGSGQTVIHGGIALWQAGAGVSGITVRDAAIDGIDCQAAGCVIDSCRITGNFQGIGAWEGSTGLVIENCLFDGNGAGGHGHNLYLQNPPGAIKTVRRCVFIRGSSNYSLHAYGEGGHVSDLLVEDCVFAGGLNLIGGWLPGGKYRVTGCRFYNADLRIGWSGINDVVSVDGCQWWGSGLTIQGCQHVAITNCTGLAFAISLQGIGNPQIVAADNVWSIGGNVFGFPDGWTLPPGLCDHNNSPAPMLLKLSNGVTNRWFVDQDPRYRGWGPGPKLFLPDIPPEIAAWGMLE